MALSTQLLKELTTDATQADVVHALPPIHCVYKQKRVEQESKAGDEHMPVCTL